MSVVLNQKANNLKEAIDLISNKAMTLFDDYESSSKTGIKRICVEIPKLSIIDWLGSQKNKTKFYWSNYDNSFEMAGIGAADIITNGDDNKHTELFKKIKNNLAISDNHIKYFGGFKFDVNTTADSSWQKFGSSCFILPRFEIVREDDNHYLALNINFSKDSGNNKITNELSSFETNLSLDNNVSYEMISRKDSPESKRWHEMIESAKTSFSKGVYEKIVLARRSDLKFSSKLSAETLLKKLKDKSPHCFHFLFQLDDNIAFIGASPERLFRRSGNTVRCEAIAGTRRRDKDESKDTQLSEELINSGKDMYEHRLVIESIIDGMTPLSENHVETDDIEIKLLKLARVQHLWGRLKFILKNNINDQEIINSLHPTAAVGGYPKNAVSDIYNLEQFDRGWYAAPIGWMGKESSEFAVAIRCGLVKGETLYLYSGAGIVKDSQANAEWEEIENKISNFLKVLS